MNAGGRLRRVCGATLALALVVAAAACSIAGGQGSVTGSLDVPDCWSGAFNLNPDFFAAVPYRDQMLLRVQSGGDYQTFSDGVSILVDDVPRIRAGLLGQALPVALSPGVTAPGVPVEAVSDPALVHVALYLQRSCRVETPALYATRAVTLNADGSCGGPESAPANCSGSAGSSPPVAASTITFTNLFSGDPEESEADRRLTDATFDVYLADPREACPGGLGPPPRCRGHLTGSFRFYFQRGKPAQPFP